MSEPIPPTAGGRTTTTPNSVAHVAPEAAGGPELLTTHDAAKLLEYW